VTNGSSEPVTAHLTSVAQRFRLLFDMADRRRLDEAQESEVRPEAGCDCAPPPTKRRRFTTKERGQRRRTKVLKESAIGRASMARSPSSRAALCAVWSEKDRENKHRLIAPVLVLPIFFTPPTPAGGRRATAGASARLRSLRSFVVNLLRSLRPLPRPLRRPQRSMLRRNRHASGFRPRVGVNGGTDYVRRISA
jgi:hypothetical protein